MRIDYATTSVISDPASGKMLILDHVKKEARTIAVPKETPPQLTPPQLQLPGMPKPQGPPSTPATSVKDLGKRLIEGHEVEGKQYTLPSLAPPKPPALPGMPGAPKPPAIPGMPGAPQLPPKPTVAEVWMSTQLHFPVLSRITGSFGQQMCHCKNAVAGEPPSSTFQIPADYKHIGLPKPPKSPLG